MVEAAEHVHPEAPEPAVRAVYRFGWARLKESFWPLLAVSIVYFLAVALFTLGDLVFNAAETADATTVALYMLFKVGFAVLALVPLGAGLVFAFLEAARGHRPAMVDLFAGFTMYVNIIGAVLLTSALVAGGLLLLIVPGLIVAARLIFVPLLVVDQELGPLEAVTRSWERTRGHTLSLVGLVLSSIPLALVGLLLLVVGIVPAMMWYYAAVAGYYRTLMERPYENPLFAVSAGPSPS